MTEPVRLIVIAGEAGTAKMAEAWSVAAPDPNVRLLHRDQVRVLFGRSIEEPTLTKVIMSMAVALLADGYSVVTAGQNLSSRDREIWHAAAQSCGAALEWRRRYVDRTEIEIL